MLELFALKGDEPSSPGQVFAGNSAVVPATSATLPEVLPIAIVSVASGVGKATPLVVPPPSLIRKYRPGAIVPDVRSVLLELLKFEPTPAYCIEYGVIAKFTVVVPRL